MAQNPNDKKPKTRIIRINLSSILYLVLLGVIAWMLFKNTDVPPAKVEWAQVQDMVLA